MREAATFGAATGLAAAATLAVLALVAWGVRALWRACTTNRQAERDLATCQAIDALGTTDNRNTQEP